MFFSSSILIKLLVIFYLDKNAKPKANAGGDQTIILPVSVIILNGSQSSDDLGIVKWEWIRDQSSLALGRVIDDTDHSPALMVSILKMYFCNFLKQYKMMMAVRLT